MAILANVAVCVAERLAGSPCGLLCRTIQFIGCTRDRRPVGRGGRMCKRLFDSSPVEGTMQDEQAGIQPVGSGLTDLIASCMSRSSLQL